jgi:hypothetical protein
MQGANMKRIWLSLCSDRIFKTEVGAFKSGDDFVEGYYCNKCKCTTTTSCNCDEHIKHVPSIVNVSL